MASNINPLNINGNYPIAGQDNDTQGFRDNFTNIKTNLTLAKAELEDLQSKVLLKTALGLTGGAPTNDMNYAALYRARLKSAGETFKDIGAITGTQSISFLDGNFQKISTNGPLTITLDDFPAAGIAGRMRLWISIAFLTGQTSATVQLPNSVTKGLATATDATASLDNNTLIITFNAAGDYLYEFVTVDSGTNFWIIRVA